ncbi:hypothetical protein COMNV_00506 [Commensalibacter sp. Nvir]|uniref:bactofilin family protein n=1 Tax=Commensalibacter sp. Nvir TaxID=3069817 RepID=UPI002D6E44CE|nr:hypothetical protein COMNV_00506 [Commensalibacter sp. Nvir]
MANNLPSILEKKLTNRNTPLSQSDKKYNVGNLGVSFSEKQHKRMLLVGQGIHIKGTLDDIEILVVEGNVETEILKTKQVIIQRSGIFHGEIETQDIEITGVVEGSIVAQGNLTVTETGKLLGKAKCRRLKVEDGGQITGQIEMITTEKLKPINTTNVSTLSQDKIKNSDSFLDKNLA